MVQFVFGRTAMMFLQIFELSECFVLTGVKNWRPKHCTVRRSAQVCQLWSFPETMQTGWSRHGWLALMVPIVVPPSGLCLDRFAFCFFCLSLCFLQVWSLAWSPDGSRLATGGLQTWKRSCCMPSHSLSQVLEIHRHHDHPWCSCLYSLAQVFFFFLFLLFLLFLLFFLYLFIFLQFLYASIQFLLFFFLALFCVLFDRFL